MIYTSELLLNAINFARIHLASKLERRDGDDDIECRKVISEIGKFDDGGKFIRVTFDYIHSDGSPTKAPDLIVDMLPKKDGFEIL